VVCEQLEPDSHDHLQSCFAMRREQHCCIHILLIAGSAAADSEEVKQLVVSHVLTLSVGTLVQVMCCVPHHLLTS
jgi:hypothetical protein